MRIVRRRSGPPPVAAAVAADQVAWDADVRPRPRRRRLLGALALGLAALLLLAAMLAARSDGGAGGMVAMGAASPSTGLSPVEDLGTLPFGENGIGPGDRMPGGGPAPGDPAAAAAAAAATGTVQPGAAVAASGGGATGGAVLGVNGGAGAGDGVPVPSTAPGGSGAPSTVATPGTTVVPTPPVGPSVPSSCSVTGATAAPSPVKRKGNSGELRQDVVVTFQSSSCGNAGFQVAVKGLVVPAASTGGGAFSAIIGKNTSGWNAGDHPITITGGGTSAGLVLQVTN